MSEPVIDLAGLREEWGPSGFEVTDAEDAPDDAPPCFWPMPELQTLLPAWPGWLRWLLSVLWWACVVALGTFAGVFAAIVMGWKP